jgi:hypothetical protein
MFCSILVFVGLFVYTGAARILPSSYDVVWTELAPVANGSSSSMPVGGGDISLNVWVENGTILFYVGKDGSFDENNSLLKLGRVRLALDPNPFEAGKQFEQRLVLEDGYIQIRGADNTIVKIWVDVSNPVIHADISTSTPVHLTASWESWRYRDHVMNISEQAQSSWNSIPNVTAITRKDNISFWQQNSILMSHRNINSRVFDASLAQQHLIDYKSELYDPLTNNTFGLLMRGEGLRTAGVTSGYYVNSSFKSWSLRSTEEKKSFDLTLVAHTNQTATHDDWETQLLSIDAAATTEAQDETIAWWHSFWNRSYIFINADSSDSDPSFQVGRNYQLFRYMLACNAGSKWPSKFNGALFTFDPVYVNPDYPFSPDFRLWGGGTYTAQNQRLEYWPLLKTGDLDIMIPQFNFYQRIVPTSLVRGRIYYDINQSWLTEQIDHSGLPQIFNFNADRFIYQTKRPSSFNPGLEFNAWTIWLSDTVVS